MIWLETFFQMHGHKYQHCLIAFVTSVSVTESGANREYETVDILGQAARFGRVIHPTKVSLNS